MKLAILGDAHLIADGDPYRHLHQRRAFFKNAWPSFQRLLGKVNDEAPDLVVFLGDLVDWFSPANIAFGLDQLSALRCEWRMTPGNHDLAAPSQGPQQRDYQTTATRDHLAYWANQGVDLSNRSLDINGTTAILLDSSLSNLADGTETWLGRALKGVTAPFIFTHVPIDTPAARDYILSVDPRRSMAKYVLSSVPHFYSRYIEDRSAQVFSAHLHFPGDLLIGRSRFHLRTMSITMDDPNRAQSTVATAAIVEAKKTPSRCARWWWIDRYRQCRLLPWDRKAYPLAYRHLQISTCI
ncbi:MAG: hypothetical protein GKR89_30200 [Candidatus Latescibacteria bacterium]|nr:hypothetical protein [Candidatus Latescibacterota bacterium]